MSKKKQQKNETKRPIKERQNTLRDNEMQFSQWLMKMYRTARRQLEQLVGRHVAPKPAAENAGAMTMPPPAGVDTAFRFTGVLVAAIVLLMLLFGGILGARLYSTMGMGNNRYRNIPLVYLQGDSTLKFAGPLLEYPVTITEALTFDSTGGYNLEKNTAVSQNGKQLLYLDNLSRGSGNLFLRDIAREKPRSKDADSRGQLVASNVLQDSFRFVEEDKAVVYMRAIPDGQGGKDLLRWSGGKENQLDGNVSRVLGLSKDGYLYYLAGMGEAMPAGVMAGTHSLCRIGTDGGVQLLAEELDGRVVEFTPETGSVLFSLPAGGDTQFALGCWDGSKSSIIAPQASGALDFGSGNQVFYSEGAAEKSNPMQYFEDDMAAQDAVMTEPVEENFMVETTNLWGGKKTALDQKAFDRAVTDYVAKQNRDTIRRSIAAQERNTKLHTLYYSTGSSTTMVDEGIAQLLDADASAGTATYVKVRVPAPKKFMLSQVSDPLDAIRLLNTVLVTTVHDYYYASVGKEPTQFLSVNKSERVRVKLDGGKGIYFIKEDVNDGGAPLSYIPVTEDGLGVAKKVDDKVISLTGLRYRDQLLYLREDSTEGNVAICAATGQNKELLMEGLPIYPLPVIYGEVLLAYRDYNEGRAAGSLTMHTGGKIKPVARNVHSYSYRLPSYIYTLRDYDVGLGEGDLYIYSGNSEKLTLVDSGVSAVKGG